MKVENVFQLLEAPSELASKLECPTGSIGDVSEDGVSIIGKEGWLYLFSGTNQYFQAYHQPFPLSRSEATTWGEALINYKTICEKYEAKFLTVIIPNKASVLNNFYPKSLLNGITPRLSMLLANIEFNILCPFIEMRNNEHVTAFFRRNDSHLTEYGNLYFVKCILESLQIDIEDLNLPGELVYIQNSGDLGHRYEPTITEIVSRIKFPRNHSYEMKEILSPIGQHTGLAYETFCQSAPIKKSILVFGNSFFDRPQGWSMAPIFCRLFLNVRFHWESGLYEQVISEFKPDYVIFQTCERFLNLPPRKNPFGKLDQKNQSIQRQTVTLKELSVRISKENHFQLVGASLPECEYYIGTHSIGKLVAGATIFPLQKLVEHEEELLKYGLVAISPTRKSITKIDVTEYIDSYIENGYLISSLQNAISPGKWALYAYLPQGDNIIEVDFGIVLPLSMKGAEFVIECEGRKPIDTFVYYDNNFGHSHWFMPAECVIGVRCRYILDERPPYITFDCKFKEDAPLVSNHAYRTLTTFTNLDMLKELPDLKRIHRVASKNANQNSFLNGGRAAYMALRKIAEENGVNFENPELSILDWGVGCGRVIRHFSELPSKNIFGIDIDEDNTNWCREHLRGNYLCVGLNPPTEINSNTFDFIYSCSVLSHLSEADASVWLAEINRILKPGGVALLSYNGISNSASYLSRRPDEFSSVLNMTLFDGDVNHELDGYIPGNDYYRASFASDEWWCALFEKHFNVVDFELSVVNGYQHIAVVSKNIKVDK